MPLRDVDHISMQRGSHHEPVKIDLDFELLTADGDPFRASRLFGRPTILVLLRYLG
jgi:hypothetical protein